MPTMGRSTRSTACGRSPGDRGSRRLAQVAGWKERWNPLVLGEPTQPAATLIFDPVVVEKALWSITGMVNLTTGSLDPREQVNAQETLRILRAKGHTAEPQQQVKSWAIRNGWTPAKADELGKLAAKVLGMKEKPRLTGIHDAEGKYESWSK